MTTRKVKGRVLNLQEQPEVGARIVFDYLKYSVKNGNYIVASSTTATVNEQGYFEKSLWCNEEGDLSSYYLARINDNDPIKFIVPLGISDIDLSVLEQGSFTPRDPQYTTLLTYVQQNIAVPTRYKERFVVDSSIVSAGGVTLTNPITLAHLVQVFLNGVQQSYGFDFNINNQKVNINTIGINDILEIVY